MAYKEYHIMTVGEIESLVICEAIANGAYEEVVEFNGCYIPDIR